MSSSDGRGVIKAIAKGSRPHSLNQLKEGGVDGATIACGRMAQAVWKRILIRTGEQRGKQTRAKAARSEEMPFDDTKETEMPPIQSRSSSQLALADYSLTLAHAGQTINLPV
eukprot:986607-Pleurochrysis_carterae.AAC.4